MDHKGQSQRNLKQQIPMALTYFRIGTVPFIVFFLSSDSSTSNHISAILIVLAALSDYWDGWLAREFKVVSKMGKILDPIADKILVSSSLVMLIFRHEIDPYLVVLSVSRDVIIDGVRAMAASENLIISAKALGKWKAAIQMTAIPLILVKWNLWGDITTYHIGYGALWLSVALSLASSIDYILDYMKSSAPPKSE